MESFFSTLKTERLSRKQYCTRDSLRADVFDYIERFYNPKRRHSTIGYISQYNLKIYGALEECVRGIGGSPICNPRLSCATLAPMRVSYTPATRKHVQEVFIAPVQPQIQWPAETYPDYLAPIITVTEDEKRETVLANFEMIPKAHLPLAAKHFSTMNARAETVSTLRSYTHAWKKGQLCLVPCKDFFEPNWETGKHVRWRIGMAGSNLRRRRYLDSSDAGQTATSRPFRTDSGRQLPPTRQATGRNDCEGDSNGEGATSRLNAVGNIDNTTSRCTNIELSMPKVTGSVLGDRQHQCTNTCSANCTITAPSVMTGGLA